MVLGLSCRLPTGETLTGDAGEGNQEDLLQVEPMAVLRPQVPTRGSVLPCSLPNLELIVESWGINLFNK